MTQIRPSNQLWPKALFGGWEGLGRAVFFFEGADQVIQPHIIYNAPPLSKGKVPQLPEPRVRSSTAPNSRANSQSTGFPNLPLPSL